MSVSISQRIDFLSLLSERLQDSESLNELIQTNQNSNPWFVPVFCKSAVDALLNKLLLKSNLQQWVTSYNLKDDFFVPKTIAIIMAGNIPLVGFHDFLCAYILGASMKIKLSSKDDVLFKFVFNELCSIDNTLFESVSFIEKMEGFDAVIATGSDNTNRYFEYYFKKYPHVLRKNRNSIAVLSGDESEEELNLLADDIFMYFGFGCRNVSKLYVPVNYDITRLFPHFKKYAWMHQHSKYMNNYDYNRTLLLLNNTPHFSDDVVMLEEKEAIASPVSEVYFEYYENTIALEEKLLVLSDKIQCVVTNLSMSVSSKVGFGKTQQPALWDYADGVDTLKFLIEL
jgi:hypothetical protein